MAKRETKDLLLDAAEALLGELGYAATSLRKITTRAKANLAAVSYHFGGKEALTRAALARRIEPINRQRCAMLDNLGPKCRDLPAILRAFLAPPLQMAAAGNGSALRMFCRIVAEQPPFLHRYLARQFADVFARFTNQLQLAAPRLSRAEVAWRLHFAVGAMTHLLLHGEAIEKVTRGLCSTQRCEPLLDMLVAALAPGFNTAHS